MRARRKPARQSLRKADQPRESLTGGEHQEIDREGARDGARGEPGWTARGRARRHVRKLIDEFYPKAKLEKHAAAITKKA